MAIVYDILRQEQAALGLPLLAAGHPQRTVAWRQGQAVSAEAFLAHVHEVAAELPPAPTAVNLCEDRYAFLVAFCAIALRGQTNLLPPSRAFQAVEEVMAAHPGCYAVGELALDTPPPHYRQLPALSDRPETAEFFAIPSIPAEQVVAMGYTSGSTGVPKGTLKTWGDFVASNGGNQRMLQAEVGTSFNVVATVPPQHSYGIEMSVLLPLLCDVAVHAGRPFFPADVATALAEVPAPRVLVTTPVHLRALIESGVSLPPLAAMMSATAPMSLELAQMAEARFGAPVLEIFGSTETCAFASRRVTADELWSLYDDVHLHPQPDGTQVRAPQLVQPMTLADIVTLHDGGRRFRLCGRHADMLEIAGKRASLGDLTHRLLAIPGVQDGVVFQLDGSDTLGIHRVAALAVAPDLDEHSIIEALRRAVDPVFLPRPLILVNALPRNETGKLPRDRLLALMGHEPA